MKRKRAHAGKGNLGAWIDRIAPGRFGGRLGLLVVAVGLIVIGVGWSGVAGSGGDVNNVPVAQDQLPWLLSGGLGLAIVVVGSALMVGSSYRESNASLRPTLEALIEVLRTKQLNGSTPSDLSHIVLAGSASYHRSDCEIAQGRPDTRLLTLDEATESNLTPCRICSPPVLSHQ